MLILRAFLLPPGAVPDSRIATALIILRKNAGEKLLLIDSSSLWKSVPAWVEMTAKPERIVDEKIKRLFGVY